MLTEAEFTTRYLQFMEEYSNTLPADLSPNERKQRIIAALDEQIAKDMDQIAETATQDLQHLYDHALLDQEEQHKAAAHQEMETIKQSLS